MAKIPITVGMMVCGLACVTLGAANGWIAASLIGAAATIGGFVWFCILWEQVAINLRKIRTYDKRVRRLEEKCNDQTDYRNLHDKSVDRKLNALEKRSSQNINGKVVFITRKEA